jgi:hypothetical protein
MTANPHGTRIDADQNQSTGRGSARITAQFNGTRIDANDCQSHMTWIDTDDD